MIEIVKIAPIKPFNLFNKLIPRKLFSIPTIIIVIPKPMQILMRNLGTIVFFLFLDMFKSFI